jgi:hypothetical protein
MSVRKRAWTKAKGCEGGGLGAHGEVVGAGASPFWGQPGMLPHRYPRFTIFI